MDETPIHRQPDFNGKPELTFENFVAGDSNYVAYSAAGEVAEHPGTKYNPLFIFCNVGQGKTHLLHAIGWEYHRRYPSGRVKLINGDEFSEELADAHDRRALRQAYSEVDLLLLDDFHLLTDRARLEMVRVFEMLQSGRKQLVLTSLRAPEEMDMDDRLRSRIEGGLVCKVLPPDVATRIAILRRKAEEAGVSIKEGVLEDIARKVTANVRKLEGAINRLVVLSKARDEMISSDFVASALRDMMPEYPSEAAEAYEAPAEGGESEFSDFISDVAKTMARISPEPSEEARLREAYAQKLYVWEMKGFVVDRLKAALDKKMDVLAREFVTFTSDVQRLIELQNRFGSLNAKRFPEEAAVIEKLLFDPSAVEEVRRRIENLAVKLTAVSPDLVEDYTFSKFKLDPSNEEAYKVMKSTAEKPRRGPDLIFMWGGEGVGKSHLVNALTKELYEKQSRINIFLLHGDLFVEDLKMERGRHARGKLRRRCLAADLLIVDDVHLIFENKYATDEFMTVLDQRVLDGLKVVLVSNRSPEETSEDPGFGRLMQEARVVAIGNPTRGLKREIAVEYLSRKMSDFTEDDVDEVVKSVGDNLWSLTDRLDQLVVDRRGRSLDLEGATILEDRKGYAGRPVGEAVPDREVREADISTGGREEIAAAVEETLLEIEPEIALHEEGVAEPPTVLPETRAEVETEAVEEAPPFDPEIELIPITEAEDWSKVPDAEAGIEITEDIDLGPLPETPSMEVPEEPTPYFETVDAGEETWLPRPETPPSIEEPGFGEEVEAPPLEAGEEEETQPVWEGHRPAPALDEMFMPSAEPVTEEGEREAEAPGTPAEGELSGAEYPSSAIEEDTEVHAPPTLEYVEETHAEPSEPETAVAEEEPASAAEELAKPIAPVIEEVSPEDTGEAPAVSTEVEVAPEEEAVEERVVDVIEPEGPPVAEASGESARAEVESVEEQAAPPETEPASSVEVVEEPPAVSEEVKEAEVAAVEESATSEEELPTRVDVEEETAPTWERGRIAPALEEIFAAPSEEEEAAAPEEESVSEPPESMEAPPAAAEETVPSADVEAPLDQVVVEEPAEEHPLSAEVDATPAGAEVETELALETEARPPEGEPPPAEGYLEPPESGVRGGAAVEAPVEEVEETPPEPAREEPKPFTPRGVDEIMDKGWEVEGERLIDSL